MSDLNLSKNQLETESGPVNLLMALDHFFSVASFYPLEHSKCQTSLIKFHQAIDTMVDWGETLVLEPRDPGVVLQGVYLDGSHKGAKSLFSLMNALGISRLELPRNAPLEDMHSAVQCLNRIKLEAESTLEFQSLDFSSIPSSVVVVHRKFGWGGFNLEDAGLLPSTLSVNLDDLAKHIEDLDWPDARKKELRLRAENFLFKTIKRMDVESDSNSVQATQNKRKLEDVLMLGTAAIGHTISNLTAQDGYHNIDQIFRKAAKSLNFVEHGQSVEMMLEVLNDNCETRNCTQNKSSDEATNADSAAYAESITDLKSRVLQTAARARQLEIPDQEHSNEMLHIYFQMLQRGNSGISGTPGFALLPRLDKLLSPPFTPDQVQILETIVSHLIQAGDRKAIDTLMPMLLSPQLRNNSQQFLRFLEHLLPENQPEKLALVWPHLVGLMLQPKQPQSQEAVTFLLACIANLPPEFRHSEAHRLDLLPVMRAGKFGPGIFQTAPQQSHGVLLALLGSRQSDLVGQLLNRTWLKNPPSNMVAVLMKIMGPYEKRHRGLYTGLLNNAKTEALEPSLKQEFSRMICSALSKLAGADRQAPWVCWAIRELGVLQCAKSRKFLEEILNQKKFFVFKSWPDPCRQAASQAIQEVSEDKAGESS